MMPKKMGKAAAKIAKVMGEYKAARWRKPQGAEESTQGR
jgi:hypothetical protein